MAHQKAVNDLQNTFMEYWNRLTTLDVKSIADHGNESPVITSATEQAAQLLSIYNNISELNIQDIPPDSSHSLIQTMKTSLDIFGRLSSLFHELRTAGCTNHLEDQFRSLDNDLRQNIRDSRQVEMLSMPPAMNALDSFVKEFKAKMQREEVATSERLSAQERRINEILQRAEKTIKVAEDAALRGAVSQQAKAFADEAVTHDKDYKFWLSITGIMVFVLFLLGVIFLIVPYTDIEPLTDPFSAAQHALAKVLIVGALSFFLAYSAKQSASHKHNAVVNKHRQNALMTYEALVNAAGDSANKDIVLTKAAESIFAAHPSGFSKGEADGAGSYSVVTLGSGAFKQ